MVKEKTNKELGITVHSDGGISITGKEGIALYRLLALRSALGLEANTGMKMSRGRSAYAMVKSEFGFKGNKQKVLAQLEALIAERYPQPNIDNKEGK